MNMNIIRHLYNCYKKQLIKKNALKYIQKKYYRTFKRIPNLYEPKSFNEKVLWIALFYHNPIYTQCADKVEVKKFLEAKLGKYEADKILCEKYGVWDNVEEIDFNILPDSFVLKSNHASGQVIVCLDKKTFNIKKAKREMKKWLNINFYYLTAEWQYKNIQPKIICEKLLEENIIDYRIFCFEGIPQYIKVTKHNEESLGGYDYAMYYPNWEKTDFEMEQNYGKMEISPPSNLEYMLEVAKKLSEDFHFVRVDFYSVDEKIYFAELTFTPNSGREKFKDFSTDLKFGEMFQIPKDEYVRWNINEKQ